MNQSQTIQRAFRVVLQLVLTGGLLFGPALQVRGALPVDAAAKTSSPGSGSAQAPSPQSNSNATALARGSQVAGARVDSAWEAAPPAAKALQQDPHNPAWRVQYGTQAGLKLIPARPAAGVASPNGPQPLLTGAWQTHVLSAGANSVVATAAAPDGRLFAGIDHDGLRVYFPDLNGVYSWTVIRAAAGRLASDNVTSLAVYNNGVLVYRVLLRWS